MKRAVLISAVSAFSAVVGGVVFLSWVIGNEMHGAWERGE